MSFAPGYTGEEIREFVYEYERQPWGRKQAWLAEQGVSHQRFRRWRIAVFDGDVDRGLVPRNSGVMTPSNQRRQIAKDHAAHDAENEQLRARVRELEATNEALGKAIGLLHQLNAQEPEEPETNDHKSS